MHDLDSLKEIHCPHLENMMEKYSVYPLLIPIFNPTPGGGGGVLFNYCHS